MPSLESSKVTCKGSYARIRGISGRTRAKAPDRAPPPAVEGSQGERPEVIGLTTLSDCRRRVWIVVDPEELAKGCGRLIRNANAKES